MLTVGVDRRLVARTRLLRERWCEMVMVTRQDSLCNRDGGDELGLARVSAEQSRDE
jgi:hypothetical protein